MNTRTPWAHARTTSATAAHDGFRQVQGGFDRTLKILNDAKACGFMAGANDGRRHESRMAIPGTIDYETQWLASYQERV